MVQPVIDVIAPVAPPVTAEAAPVVPSTPVVAQVPGSSLGRGAAGRSGASGPSAGVAASGAAGPAPGAAERSRSASASAGTPAVLVSPAGVARARDGMVASRSSRRAASVPLATDGTLPGMGVRAAGAPGFALLAPSASIAAAGSPALMHRAVGAGSASGVGHRDPAAPAFPRLPGGLAGLGASAGASGGGVGGAGGPGAVLFWFFALAVGAGARFVRAGSANRSTAVLSLIERPG